MSIHDVDMDDVGKGFDRLYLTGEMGKVCG